MTAWWHVPLAVVLGLTICAAVVYVTDWHKRSRERDDEQP